MMKLLLLTLAAVVAVVYSGNSACWSVDQIADAVILETDTNKDGILELDEITRELIDSWSLSNDSCLSYHVFTQQWTAHFHDHKDTSHAFFNNLDNNGDSRLCLDDVAVQIVTFDDNPRDGKIQPDEFRAFMHNVHPDSHHIGGHGHGC